MRRRFSKSTRKTGLPPGSLVPAHPERTEKVNIVLTRCDDGGCLEKKPQSAKELFPLQPGGVNWIDIDGIHDIELIREIGEGFGLHPLFLEDIATTGQNPKVEDFGAYIFLVLKALSFNEMTGEIDAEQVSIVFGENYVISFREHPTPLFNAIRGRIGASSTRFLKMGADYLAYSLFDVVVDNYFVVLEKYGDSVEAAEEALLNHPRPGTLQSIYRLKREALFLRRSVWLARDTMNFLYLSESALIKQPTRVYIRDVYEHIVQVIDTAENYREMVFGMLDIYLSSVSYRLNEVMKVLTIISTIFIPLTFLVGVYGMNFEYMPELKKHWAYPTLWAVMVALALGMVAYFKKKKWF